MSSVNYLLAACAHRAERAGSGLPGKEVLRAHVRELAKTHTEDLAQVTILRALPLVRNARFVQESNYYWDVTQELCLLRCPTTTVDVTDHCFSYSSWVQAIAKWRTTFDYYILIEDDYYPAHPRFVEILLGEHTRKLPSGGFLNGFTTDHAACAYGVVDSATFVRCLDQLTDPIAASEVGQRGFGRVFCDDRLADYSDRYRCLFSSSDVVELVHGDINGIPLYACTEDLIRPLECLALEGTFRRVVSSYPERIGCRTT